jgi:Fe-S-cluster containining protein
MEDLKSRDLINVTNHCCNGVCSNCGECCTDIIPLTKNEVKNIRAYIKKHNIKERVYMDDTTFDFRCPFYIKDSDKHCAIYPVRPLICQKFKCNQDKSVIASNKELLSMRADYNKFYNWSYHHTFISLHNLFYKNYAYEIQSIYSLCLNNKELMQDFLNKECLNKYSFTDLDIEFEEEEK